MDEMAATLARRKAKSNAAGAGSETADGAQDRGSVTNNNSSSSSSINNIVGSGTAPRLNSNNSSSSLRSINGHSTTTTTSPAAGGSGGANGGGSPRMSRNKFGQRASEERSRTERSGPARVNGIAAGSGNNTAASGGIDLDAFKNSIMQEMRAEIDRMKDEIILAIKSELNRG